MKASALKQKLLLLTCLLFSVNVSAYVIDVTDTAVATGNETSQASIDVIIASYISPSTELYKANVNENDFNSPVEELALASSYSTVFTGDDPNGAIVSYDGGTIIDPTHLLVKDGKQQPAWYLFDLSAWDGVEDLILTNFWVGPGGGISHISLYGGESTTDVAEPGNVALLALGILGLVFTRRKLCS